MHRHERIGFFDRTLRVVDPIPALVELYEPFAHVAEERLGKGRLAALLELVRRHADDLANLDRAPALVHGDFRPANMLVHAGKLVAILDWKFAMPGTLLPTSVNSCAARTSLRRVPIDAMVSGYEQASGRVLPDNWRTLCRVRDLLHLLQMLKGNAVPPRQHAEVLSLIDRTLALDCTR